MTGPSFQDRSLNEEELYFPEPDFSLRDSRTSMLKSGDKDIGWARGLCSDGRPYLVELWISESDTLIMSIYFSRYRMESLDSVELMTFVEAQSFYERKSGTFFDFGRINDDCGNQMWSINVVMEDRFGKYAENKLPLND
ncbi:MAG: hypothetical protein GYA55_02850 [SAR324 cluster bacterium]|uniref:Uncharacterized protein n=1 Tax=SAR324 cluster bacterium TaxID=2024889 RepID=A0A7X9IJH9_9DELT|nr:hypothetical protein [SAR324 cluster bacterium]